MAKRAVFIDRDGVIIEERNYAYRTEDLKFIPGSVEGLRALSRSGYRIIIVTNQAGIARGFFTEEDYQRFTAHLLGLLKDDGVRIDAVYFCPHHPTEGIGEYKTECECRKPKAGMLKAAAKEHGLDLRSSWLVGDKASDIKAGKDAGCRAILVKTGYAGSDAPDAHWEDFTTDDLFGAVGLILEGLC